MTDKVVLAYSGGLDTSISINWIKENYKMDVIAALIDCGQSDDLEEAYQRALDTGACEAIIVDGKDDFIQDFIYPAIKSNMKYEKTYPLATALARPLIVKKLVEVA
jgi:argininosuccinate synthase